MKDLPLSPAPWEAILDREGGHRGVMVTEAQSLQWLTALGEVLKRRGVVGQVALGGRLSWGGYRAIAPWGKTDLCLGGRIWVAGEPAEDWGGKLTGMGEGPPGIEWVAILGPELALGWFARPVAPGQVKVYQSLWPPAIAAILQDLDPQGQSAGSWDLTILPQRIDGLIAQDLAQIPLTLGPPPSLEPTPLVTPALMQSAVQELAIPLTNMKTALRLLESLQQKKEQRQRYLDLIRQDCDRQNSLLTGLQELIHLENSPTLPDRVQMEDCIPGVVSTYQPIAQEKGITLGYTLLPTPLAIACSASDLRSILQHLLHNSLKFTPAGGRVQVKVQGHGRFGEVIVSDSGCGIEMADIPHLFECFYRGRQNPPTAQGAGLGLAIVQQLVQRRGGKITVNSQGGRGSHFHIILPLALD